VHAFADEWGFGDESESESESEEEEADTEWEGGYKHRSFSPLPLPRSLCSDLGEDSADTDDDDDDDFNPFGGESTRDSNSLVDALLADTCSPFDDVRRTGWQNLARATNEAAIAGALLKARVDGEGGIVQLAAAVLEQDATNNDVIADTQRCIMKTLLNVARMGGADGCCSLRRLKTHIIRFSGHRHPLETRSVAVQLMQCLLNGSDSADKNEYMRAIKGCARSDSKCRVSRQAVHALHSLKIGVI